MIIEDIIELSEARPFVPFEVHVAAGKSFMVEHPKWMMFSPDFRTLMLVGKEHPAHQRISVPLITHLSVHEDVQPAEVPAAARS